MKILRAFLLVLAMTPVWSGCSKLRGMDSEPFSTPYAYPHAKEWPTSHVAFMAKSRKEIEGTDRDCTVCHEGRTKAVSLNVSCASACHSPSTSEARESNRGHVSVVALSANTCTSCHSSMISPSPQFAHFPVATGLCDTCHDASPRHVAGLETTGVTTKSADNSCYQCHFRKDDQPNVHPALKMGNSSCTHCHNPHGSNNRYFVREIRNRDLCSKCHTTHTGVSVHGAEMMGKDCLNCHVPHSTTTPKLLIQSSDDLCYSCHNREIATRFASPPRIIPNIWLKMKGLPFRHRGTQKGCATCHLPHSSPFEQLLVKNYSTSNYNLFPDDPASPTNPYQLCFSCHDYKIFDPGYAQGAFRTDFAASGTVNRINWHWFHVVDATGDQDKSQGRSCRVCHDPHGANQDFVINDHFRMNNAEIPIVFTRNIDGGTCTRTCHESATYKRSTPGVRMRLQ